MVGAGSLVVVGTGSSWVVVGMGFLGVVGAGSLVVVGDGLVVVGTAPLELVGVVSLAVVGIGLLGAVTAEALVVVSALGVGLAGTLDVGTESLADVFSELRVSLAEVVFSFALEEVCLFVSVDSLPSCPLPFSSTTGGSGLVSFLGVLFLLSFTREKITHLVIFNSFFSFSSDRKISFL